MPGSPDRENRSRFKLDEFGCSVTPSMNSYKCSLDAILHWLNDHLAAPNSLAPRLDTLRPKSVLAG